MNLQISLYFFFLLLAVHVYTLVHCCNLGLPVFFLDLFSGELMKVPAWPSNCLVLTQRMGGDRMLRKGGGRAVPP